MNRYLNEVARQLLNEHGQDLTSVLVLVPTRRSGLFLRKHLAELAGRPIWSPHIQTLESFFAESSGQTLAPQTDLLMRLHPIFNQTVYEEPFERFYFWGQVILEEFERIDQALAAPHELFRVLLEEREIDAAFPSMEPEARALAIRFWKGFVPETSKIQDEFLRVWRNGNNLYQAFQAHLKEQRLSYPGQAVRQFVEQAEAAQIPSFSQIYLLDPIWITTAQEKAIQKLARNQNLQVFWNPSHSAEQLGSDAYYRRRKAWQSSLGKAREMPEPELSAQITAYQAGGQEGQASCLAGLLLDESISFEDTAVVLPSSLMLMPTLRYLPPSVQSLNISIGHPATGSSIPHWFYALSRLQKSVRREAAGQEIWLKSSRLLKFLELPAVSEGFSSQAAGLTEAIIKSRKPETARSELQPYPAVLAWLDPLMQEQNHIIDLAQQWCDRLAEENLDAQGVFTQTAFYLSAQLRRVREGLRPFLSSLTAEAQWKIVDRVLKSTKTPFSGEPLTGLQILGLQETANLDFKRVIVLQTNEGSLPSSGSAHGLIPFHLKKAFGMDLPEDREKTEGLLLFQLMERAERVDLVYNNQIKSGDTGEPSRFIRQWELMHNRLNPLPSLAEPLNIRPQSPIPISISKQGAVGLRLQNYLGEKELSASTLNDFMACGLRFYLSKLQGIQPREQPAEQMDAAMLGTLIHSVLEDFYKAHPLGEPIDKEWIRSQGNEAHLKELVAKALQGYFKSARPVDQNKGELVLLNSVVLFHVKQVLKQDAESPYLFYFLGAEERLNLSYELENGMQVKFKGYVDRVDVLMRPDGEVFRLLDYKTGKYVESKISFVAVAEAFPNENPHKKELFQVLLYGWMAMKGELPGERKIAPGLWFIRSRDSDGNLRYKKSDLEDFRELAQEFEEQLNQVLLNLVDLEQSFEQTENLAECAYCAFKTMCGR